MTTSEEEFSELVDANFPRVDLVGKAANGVGRFLIAKSAFAPEFVSALIDSAPGGAAMTDVAKATPDIEPSDLNADGAVLVGTDDGSPGSKSWETVDADTAMKWLGILARAEHAIEVLRDREAAEAQSDPDSWEDVDALCATLCAISDAVAFLAPFAVGEAAEAAFADEDPSEYGVFKAALSLDKDPFPLTTIESLMPVIKGHGPITSDVVAKAAAALTDALSVLPAASEEKVQKMTDEIKKANSDTGPQDEISAEMLKDGQFSQATPSGHSEIDGPNQLGYEVTPADNTVAVPADVKTLSGLASSQDDLVGTDASLTGPVVDTGVVSKGAPQQAVYDSKGNLLGTVDPSKITELVGEGTEDAKSSVDAPSDETKTEGVEDAPKAPEGAAPAAPPADMAPAHPGTVGTPAEGVEKALDVAEIVKAAVAEATSNFDVVVKALQNEIETLKAPAQTRVLSNGALPPTHMLRGMDKGTAPVDVAKSEEFRQRLDAATSMDEREAISKEMNDAAIDAWNAMRSNR